MKTTPLLEVHGLSKMYPVGGGRKGALLHAVDNVDLLIGRGESVGLVGESGCGKSTLARLVAWLTPASSGRIVFDGQNLSAMLPGHFERSPDRARIQVVFQHPTDSLNPALRVFDAIADPLQRLFGIRNTAELERRVRRAAELVGLPDGLVTCHPHQLSGGQRVRVGIARAIVVEPSLLILDEPTAALDVSVQAGVLRLLVELRARLGMSYLFVSRDPNVARLLCERIAVMYLGRVVEVAATDALFSAPAHPYTQALIAALPDPARRGEKRMRLDGDPKSPVDPNPNTCRFHGRCPAGADRCVTASPALRRIDEAHFAACHFA